MFYCRNEFFFFLCDCYFWKTKMMYISLVSKIVPTLPLYALSFSEKAEVFLCKGNERCREKDFVDAIRLYTEGIEVNCKDGEVKAKLHSNRAKAYFGLGELSLHRFLIGRGGSTC